MISMFLKGLNFVSRRAVPFVAILLVSSSVFAQGTLQITFDGPPVIPINTARYVSSYSESGMLVTPMKGSDRFGRLNIK